MEHVVGRAEKLAKDKVKKDLPPPFQSRVTESLYMHVHTPQMERKHVRREPNREQYDRWY